MSSAKWLSLYVNSLPISVGERTVMSSAKWLSTHGLAARKLTILDALAPTFIPHHPKYVRILGKKVEAKVFDDVSDYRDMQIYLIFKSLHSIHSYFVHFDNFVLLIHGFNSN